MYGRCPGVVSSPILLGRPRMRLSSPSPHLGPHYPRIVLQDSEQSHLCLRDRSGALARTARQAQLKQEDPKLGSNMGIYTLAPETHSPRGSAPLTCPYPHSMTVLIFHNFLGSV